MPRKLIYSSSSYTKKSEKEKLLKYEELAIEIKKNWKRDNGVKMTPSLTRMMRCLKEHQENILGAITT